MDLFNRGRVVLAASHGPEMDDRNLRSLNVLPFKNGAKEKQKGNQISFKGFNKAARGIVECIYIACEATGLNLGESSGDFRAIGFEPNGRSRKELRDEFDEVKLNSQRLGSKGGVYHLRWAKSKLAGLLMRGPKSMG